MNWIRITKVTGTRMASMGENADPSFTDTPTYAALSAYPNPAINNITIDVPEGMENCNVKIMDLAGNSLRETALSGNTLDISDLKAGIYILWLEQGGEHTPLRVVKQ